jgi:arsenate reductase (thioredoxin)
VCKKPADPDKGRGISAETNPGPNVHPEVVTATREVGIDLAGASTTELTPEPAGQAQVLVTMGCGDECPYIPDAKRSDCPLEDPKGKPLEKVREIRDQIRDRVQQPIDAEGLAKQA